MIALRKAHSAEDGWKYGVNVNDGTSMQYAGRKGSGAKASVAQAIRSAADISAQLIRIELITHSKEHYRRLVTMTSSSDLQDCDSHLA